MNAKSVIALAAVAAVALVLVLGSVALAQVLEQKPYAEGQGARRAGVTYSADSAGHDGPEGQAGQSGRARLDEVNSFEPLAPAAANLLYVFSGVTDDGEQGSASRREATVVHCTNIGTTSAQVEVQIYQWNGTDVYTGTAGIPANRTFTYATQNTTIYFDDILLGGSPGTDAIFQGHGRVYSSHSAVICTAQALDPLNQTPTFMTKLTLFTPDGMPAANVREIYLPYVVR